MRSALHVVSCYLCERSLSARLNLYFFGNADTCMTSIFSSSWMCRLCGREACAECFAQVRELTTDRDGATEAEIAALQARREKHAHINPFFLSCTRRNEHRASDFSPMSRFSKDELDQAIIDMAALSVEPPAHEASLVEEKVADKPSNQSANGHSALNGVLNGVKESAPANASNGKAASSASSEAPQDERTPGTDAITHTEAAAAVPTKNPDTEVSLQIPKTLESPAPPEPSTFASASTSPGEAATGISTIPSHETRTYTDGELTDDIFQQVWKRGEPVLVTNLESKFRLEWTPEYFKSKYGNQSCLILECQSDQNKRVTVGEFFSWFGKYEGRRDCWKLKVRGVFPTDVHPCQTRLNARVGLAAIHRFQIRLPRTV